MSKRMTKWITILLTAILILPLNIPLLESTNDIQSAAAAATPSVRDMAGAGGGVGAVTAQ